MKHKSWLKWSLLLVSLALLIVSGTMVVRLLRQGEQEQQAFDDLAALVTPSPEEPEAPLELPTDVETEVEEAPSPYAALKEQNEDFYGWLSIEGTEIDYPVMYTPTTPSITCAAALTELRPRRRALPGRRLLPRLWECADLRP